MSPEGTVPIAHGSVLNITDDACESMVNGNDWVRCFCRFEQGSFDAGNIKILRMPLWESHTAITENRKDKQFSLHKRMKSTVADCILS